MSSERAAPASLEERLREALSGQWRLAVATAGGPGPALTEGALTEGERQQYARLTDVGPRRHTWLLGRQALRALLARLGEPPDTSALRFPHPRLSLSHSAGVAIAGAPVSDACGAGIDVESARRPTEALARFFLTPAERCWLAEQPARRRPTHLLRLWTVKEAVFKANLSNQDTGLHHYRLADCAALRGAAECPQQSAGFDYRTAHIDGLVVSAAIRVVAGTERGSS